MPGVDARPDPDRPASRALAYVVACQPLHERLRDAAIQLGGLSLAAMLPRAAEVDAETPLRMASETLAETREAILGIRVPAAARHHHHHMSAAAEALGRVAGLMADDGLARGGAEARREASAALREATDHLRHAANAMPGFETVDLRHSCCAAHARTVLSAEPAELNF